MTLREQVERVQQALTMADRYIGQGSPAMAQAHVQTAMAIMDLSVAPAVNGILDAINLEEGTP